MNKCCGECSKIEYEVGIEGNLKSAYSFCTNPACNCHTDKGENKCKLCKKILSAKGTPRTKYCNMVCFREYQRQKKYLKGAILEWNIDRVQDIIDDVEEMPEWKTNGSLLGIRSVAMGIRASLAELFSKGE